MTLPRTVEQKAVADASEAYVLTSDFFTPDGQNKIVGADNVYAEYRPDRSYSLHAINPVTEPFEPGEFNP